MGFGKFDVDRGERCSNNGYGARFTTPCCYEDLEDDSATECPNCKAPIQCEVEYEPVSVCTIRDDE